MDSTRWVVQGVLLADGIQWHFIWATLGLVAVLLAGAFIIALMDRWRKRSDIPGLSAGDQLTHFRRLYEQGTISKEEFERIRSQLSGDFRKELNLDPAPAPTPPAGAPTLTEPPGDGQAPAP